MELNEGRGFGIVNFRKSLKSDIFSQDDVFPSLCRGWCLCALGWGCYWLQHRSRCYHRCTLRYIVTLLAHCNLQIHIPGRLLHIALHVALHCKIHIACTFLHRLSRCYHCWHREPSLRIHSTVTAPAFTLNSTNCQLHDLFCQLHDVFCQLLIMHLCQLPKMHFVNCLECSSEWWAGLDLNLLPPRARLQIYRLKALSTFTVIFSESSNL